MRKITILFAFVMAFQMMNAQNPGDLDMSFGENGIVQTAIGDDEYLVDQLTSITLQPDGKIIAMGSSREGSQKRIAFVRYNEDGSIDTSFGNNGIVIVIPYAEVYLSAAMDAAILEDGKIAVCARIYDPNQPIASSIPVMIKMNSDGSMDQTFGDNGLIVYDMGENSCFVGDMAVQEDGKFLFTGYYNDALLVMRLNADGSIDESYGTNGVFQMEVNNTMSFSNDIALQEDGKAVIAGNAYDYDVYGQAIPKPAVLRLNEDGTLDTSFGDNGIMMMSFGEGNDYATTIKVQKDGKILVGGNSWDANAPILKYSCVAVRLNEDGSMDDTFAESGMFRMRYYDEGENYVTDIIEAEDNNIYMAISVTHQWGNINAMGVTCLSSDGKLRTDFGENGCTLIDLTGTHNSMAIALQEGGKVILSGEFANDYGFVFALARFHGFPYEGLTEFFSQTQLVNAYPNPVNDVLNIDYEGDFNVQIIDVTGRVVFTAENSRSLNVSSLESGNYIIKLVSDNETLFNRFIKL